MKPLQRNATPLNQLKIATTLALCLASAACAPHARPLNTPPGNSSPIPSRWVDLPEAPFVAQLRDGAPVLVARSRQTFSQVSGGCVIEVDGKAHVIADLITHLMTHGGFGPNWPVTDLILNLTDPERYRHISGWSRCPAGSFFAVTNATAVDRNGAKDFVWEAEGTPWIGRRR
jgi:hypothetical protein